MNPAPLKSTNGFRTVYYAVAGAMAVGGLCFGLGTITAPNCESELDTRLRKLEETVVRWDERWVHIQSSLLDIKSELTQINNKSGE